MDIQKISAERLNPATYNPRKDLRPEDKEYKKLRRSIEEFGYVEPVIWNRATGNVVGGHQRLKVLIDLGHTEIDCVVVDLSAEQEKALNIALNKIQGDWDEAKLAELMADLDVSAFDVSLTGFDADEVDALLDRFYSKDAVQDDFDVDKEKEAIEKAGAVTRPGDYWLMGGHRLMCGDAASAEDFTRLMGDTVAQVAVTAPPEAGGADYEKSGVEPWLGLVRPVARNLSRHADIVCWQMIDLYNTGTQFMEPTGLYSAQAFAEHGLRPIWMRVWKKTGALPGKAPAQHSSAKPTPEYEYVTAFAAQAVPEYNDQEYVWVSAFAGHSYKFVKRLTKEERKNWGYSGVWDIAPVRTAKKHPAMFPVELPWRCIKMHSDQGGIVLDPFAGSGTTIIAAEQAARKCYAMELSPVYCDLAVKRWEKFTGETATRIEAQA